MNMSFSKLLVISCYSYLITSCSPKFHETLIDQRTGKTIGGYCDDCELSMRKEFIINEQIKKELNSTWKQQGVDVSFQKTGFPYLISVEGKTFATSKGIQVGDSMKKVRKYYGRPWKQKHYYITLGQQNNFYYGSAYIYKDISFFYDKGMKSPSVLYFNIGKLQDWKNSTK